jgi:hypothetical protein
MVALGLTGIKLIRRKRIFLRTDIHNAPKVFMFLPLVSKSSEAKKLNKHLVRTKDLAKISCLPLQIDRIFISHYHHPEDGFSHLEDLDFEGGGHLSSFTVVRSTLPQHGECRRFEIEVCLVILVMTQAKMSRRLTESGT